MTKICIIQGHPDLGGKHLCHALANSYQQGATEAGHDVTLIDIAALTFDVLRDPAKMAQPPNEAIAAAQKTIGDAEHFMIIYPLWLGTMPALVKAFL
jgi:putative NADPH-quinone reductase